MNCQMWVLEPKLRSSGRSSPGSDPLGSWLCVSRQFLPQRVNGTSQVRRRGCRSSWDPVPRD